MGYDPFSPISLAQINVICLPASRISRQEFSKCVEALRRNALIPIKNGSPSSVSDGAAAAKGWVLLNISDSFIHESLTEIYPFDSNREPQIIVGITIGQDEKDDFPHQSLEDESSLTTTFKGKVASYRQTVTSVLLHFGAASTIKSDGRIYVQDEQNQGSIMNAISEVVSQFQRSLPGFLEQLRGRSADLPSLSNSTRRMSISSNASNRTDIVAATEGRFREASQQVLDSNYREIIAFGHFYLQAGQWSNALRLLSEGTINARASADHLWHARGLEGLIVCMLLMLWSETSFKIPQACFPANERQSQMGYSNFMEAILNSNRASSLSLFSNTSTRPSDMLTELLPHLLGYILGLYERAINNIDSTVPFLILCEARVRWLSLLITVRSYGGSLTTACVRGIVEANPELYISPASKSSASSLVLQRTALSQMLASASLEASAKLSIEASAPLQLALAKGFSILGIDRKQGFHLKQFLQRLAPAIIEARRRGAAELGVHPSTNVPQSDDDDANVDLRDPHRGIGTMLQFVGNAYGLPTTNNDIGASSESPMERLVSSLKFWFAVHNSGDLFMKLEILAICIEISDALPDPRSSLFFTSQLLEASKQSITVSAHHENSTPLISPQDLPRILHNIQRAVVSAESRGIPGCRAEYWDKFLVRDIALLQDSKSNRLVPHTAQDLSMAASAEAESKKDPFIFNPFSKPKISRGAAVVSIGDFLYFDVLLQNPLETEIEIETIMIQSEGSRFKPTSHSIVLGPLCSQVFTLNGIPEESGELTIVGCLATIRGCLAGNFLILPDEWKPPHVMKQKAHSKFSDEQQLIKAPAVKTLPLKVIEPLPLLSVSSITLPQPSLMLIDGERKTFNLTLHNESTIDIDFVSITFDDSVKQQLEEALASKTLSPADTYEVQLQIIQHPAVKLLQMPTDLRIRAGDTYTFDLEVMGKPGLTSISVLVDYTSLGKPRSQVTETFYTRQLNYSIATTVNGGVDIPRCMILPFESDTGLLLQRQTHNTGNYEGSISINMKEDQCMLLLDMRNLWPHPLEVNCWVVPSMNEVSDASSVQRYTTSELLQPGQVTRVLLIVPRIFIPDVSAAIPNLDARRQFVVSVSNLSIEAEAATREAFWYREKLLACLNADWKEEYGSKSGQVDLRKGVRLNARMIEALRIDPVEISFILEQDTDADLKSDETDSVAVAGTSHYILKRNRFAILVARVHNRGDTELSLLLRLQPSLRNQPHTIALELSKRFVWSGSLQQALHPPLRAGETREMRLGVLVLATGEYEVNGLVEEIRRGSTLAGTRLKGLGPNSERRIWHARRSCQIDVISGPDDKINAE